MIRQQILFDDTNRPWLVREAKSEQAARNSIAHARVTGSVGDYVDVKTHDNETGKSGPATVVADVIALDDPYCVVMFTGGQQVFEKCRMGDPRVAKFLSTLAQRKLRDVSVEFCDGGRIVAPRATPLAQRIQTLYAILLRHGVSPINEIRGAVNEIVRAAKDEVFSK